MTNKKTAKNTASKVNQVDVSLIRLGLTEHQSLVYRTLVDLGPSRAFKVSLNSGLKRALTYKVLDQLKTLGLVESKESEGSKIVTFQVTHPAKIEELIQKKREVVSEAENAYIEIIQSLTSSYNTANKKPNVVFWEGLGGLKRVYDDILLERKDILLFRSSFDITHQESRDLIRETIKRQVNRGIHTRAITPLIEPANKAYTVAKDKDNLVTRRFIKIKDFNMPAQVIIYGDKVAITSYREHLMTTIIENKDIRDSLVIIFELVWSQGIIPEDIFGKIE